MHTYRIFISSPGDVGEERAVAGRVVRRLQGWFRGRAVLETYFWEHEPMRATATFQDQITRPSECEVVVCILWSRLGSRLPAQYDGQEGRWRTGTEFEFEDAAAGFRERGLPDLLVYRKTAPLLHDISEPEEAFVRKRADRVAVERFFQEWFASSSGQLFTGAYHEFGRSAEFEEALENHLRKLLQQKMASEEGVGALPLEPWWVGSPFRGLEPFDVEHQAVFFGRSRAVEAVIQALRDQVGVGRAFVLLVGMSGCGKSSLARAGVLPLLTQPGVIEGVGLCRHAVMRPGASSDPVFALAEALLADSALPELGADGTKAASLADMMRQSPVSALALVKGALSQAAAEIASREELPSQPAARLVLVVDQMEELFATSEDAAQSALVEILDRFARSGLVWILATLRSDFYPMLQTQPKLVDLKEGRGQYDVLPPAPSEVGEMIRQPAMAAGLYFEERPDVGRLDDVLRDAALASPDALPLLQFTLAQLYERREGNRLHHAAYQDLGGITGALARRAEEVYATLDSDAQASFPAVMRELVEVRKTREATRRLAPYERVAKTAAARDLVDRFVAGRLLTTDRSGETPVVQLAHETLLRSWPRMTQWLDADREALLARSRLIEAARRWDTEGRRADLLLPQGRRLTEARDLAEDGLVSLGTRERTFLAASLRRERREARAKRIAVAALGALAIVTTVLAVQFRGVSRAARDAAKAERRNAELAEDRLADAYLWAGRAAESSAERLLYAAAATARRDDAETRGLLVASAAATGRAIWQRAGVSGGRPRIAVSEDGQTIAATGSKVIHVWRVADGRESSVRATEATLVDVALAPNGDVLGLDARGRVCRWRLPGGELVETHDVGGPALGFSLHPSGTRVACAGQDGSIRVIDLDGTEAPRRWDAHEGAVTGLAFSPLGDRLVSVGLDGFVRLWEEGERRQQIGFPESGIPDVSWDRRGRHVAVALLDGSVRLWSPESDEEPRRLEAHPGGAACVVHTHTGDRLVTGGLDGTVRSWDLHSLEPMRTLTTGSDVVSSMRTSGDDALLVTISTAGTLQLWESDTGTLRSEVRGHAPEVEQVAFLGDGRLVSTGDDGTLRVWEAGTGRAEGTMHLGDYLCDALAVSPDGRWLAVGRSDGTVLVWDTSADAAPRTLEFEGLGLVRSLAFGPRGRWLAVGGAGSRNPIRWWDLEEEKVVWSFQPEPLVWDLACTADGRRLAAGADSGLHLYDLASGQEEELPSTPTPDTPVHAVAFSPNGRLLAYYADDDTAIRIWNTQTGALTALRGHRGRVRGLVFYADGRHLASGGEDGTLRVWNVEAQRELACLAGHEGAVTDVALDPTRAYLATAGARGAVRVWRAWDPMWVAQLVAKPPDGMSEWTRLLAFHPNGERLLGVTDLALRSWDHVAGRERTRLDTPVTLQGGTLRALSADGRRLAHPLPDGSIRVVDLETEREIGRTADVPPPRDALALDAQGHHLLLFGTGDARLWRVAEDREEGHWSAPSRVHAPVFSPDGEALAYGDAEGGLTIRRRLPEARPLRVRAHTGPLLALAYDPTGTRLVSGGYDARLRAWEAEGGEPDGEFSSVEALRSITAIAFHPDGRWLASGERDGTVRLWDARDRRELARFQAEDGWIVSLAFHPTLPLLACGKERSLKVSLWHLDPLEWPASECLERAEARCGFHLVGFDAFAPSPRDLQPMSSR